MTAIAASIPGRGPKIAVLIVLLVCVNTALAQIQRPQRPFGLVTQEWLDVLSQARIDIAQPELTRDRIAAITDRVDTIRREAGQRGNLAERQLQRATHRLEALGPAPESDHAETDRIRQLREQLQQDEAFYRARTQTAALAATEAELLLIDLTHARRVRRWTQYAQLGPSPLSLQVFRAGAAQWQSLIGHFTGSIGRGIERARQAGYRFSSRLRLLLVPLLLMIALWPLRRWLLRRFGRNHDVTEPSYGRRLTAVFVEGLARGLIPTITLLLLFVALPTELVTGGVATLVTGTLFSLSLFLWLSLLVLAGFSPDATQWRIVPVAPEASKLIGKRLLALAAVVSFGIFVGFLKTDLSAPAPELAAINSLVLNTIVAALLLSLLRRDLWRPESRDTDEQAMGGNRIVNVVIVLLALVISSVPVLAALGYRTLSDHVTWAVLFTGLLIALTLLLREILAELIELVMGTSRRRHNLLQRSLALSEQANDVMVFWAKVVTNVVLFSAMAILLLRAWGMEWDSIKLLLLTAAQGLSVGDITIAPRDIASSIVLFGIILTLTRLLQNWLGDSFLPRTQIQPYLQHSITTGIGFVGVILASVAAFGALGLNFQNVAIIAGALSVGIGFGLQNVVNNFVSGLILLIEHPVSVGDWIRVGAHEGYVKRINIRSTEVETFTRATVIIPNSELVSSAVVNNTLKNRHGRLEVPVGIAYGSDLIKVNEVLLRCLRQHSQILAFPEPYVIFVNFGDSSLDFECRGFVADVDNRLIVTSELRFAISTALRDAGIAIPFPQRDLHLRDIGSLGDALRDGGQHPATGAADTRPDRGAPPRQPRIRGELPGQGDGDADAS